MAARDTQVCVDSQGRLYERWFAGIHPHDEAEAFEHCPTPGAYRRVSLGGVLPAVFARAKAISRGIMTKPIGRDRLAGLQHHIFG